MHILIELMKLITNVGRKLTAVIWSVACLTALGVLQIVLLKTEPTICLWMIGGTTGFFFGFNILGDHIFGGGDNEGTKDSEIK